MKHTLIAALSIAAILVSGSVGTAEARSIAAVGTIIKTTVRHADGTTTVTYPNGKREVLNPDGSKQGRTRVCSNGRTGGNIVTCYYVN